MHIHCTYHSVTHIYEHTCKAAKANPVVAVLMFSPTQLNWDACTPHRHSQVNAGKPPGGGTSASQEE